MGECARLQPRWQDPRLWVPRFPSVFVQHREPDLFQTRHLQRAFELHHGLGLYRGFPAFAIHVRGLRIVVLDGGGEPSHECRGHAGSNLGNLDLHVGVAGARHLAGGGRWDGHQRVCTVARERHDRVR